MVDLVDQVHQIVTLEDLVVQEEVDLDIVVHQELIQVKQVQEILHLLVHLKDKMEEMDFLLVLL